MTQQPLPLKIAEFARRKNLHNPRYGGGKGTDNEHYVSGCLCGNPGHDWSKGDPDRFVMRPDGTGKYGDARWWCRWCNKSGWIDHELEEGEVGTPSPEAIADMQRRREAIEREQERERKQKLTWLRHADFWIRAHEEMQPEHYRMWKREHYVEETTIRLHKLGHRDEDDNYHESLTIPYFYGGNGPDELQTLQFRLCNYNGTGKYRFIAGLGDSLFFPMPIDTEIKDNVILITEGAKKGMVVAQLGWRGTAPLSYQGHDITLVSVPSKKISPELMNELAPAARLIWLLDPDAYTPKKRNGEIIPPDIEALVKGTSWTNSRIIRPAGKVDDMIGKYGMEKHTLQSMINQSAPYMRQYQK